MSRSPYRALPALALTFALAFAAPAVATVASSRSALDAALAQHESASARLDVTSQRLEEVSGELDRTVAEQQDAQARLNDLAASMYRSGRSSVLEFLLGAKSFDDLSARWFLLTRINRQTATEIASLKTSRAKIAKLATSLLAQESQASAQVRALDGAVTKARADLASSQAEFAAYQRTVAERDAARAAAARLRAKARPVTGGGWSTAKCSNYGPGSYGRRTANGTRIGPDSMIVAHKTLPFGTVVEFAYGGKSAIAVVADRGPYVAGREFDLGPGVAHVLGLNGVYNVRYRIIGR